MKTLPLLLLIVSSGRAASQGLPSAAAGATAVASAPVSAAALPSGTVESSKIRLAAHDAAGALSDAETAIVNGGGADAYAARADAKRALGRPVDEVISDYGAAANLDPHYIEKYKGLIVQRNSEAAPDSASKRSGEIVENGANALAKVIAVALVGGLFGIAAMVWLRGRGRAPLPERSKVAGGSPPSRREAPKDS